MEFIDHTGHIFSLPSYDEEPIGYEYEQLKYVFWLNAEHTFNLSVNNYYIKSIKAIIPVDDFESEVGTISCTINSKIFKFINPDKLKEVTSINSTLNLNETTDMVSDVIYYDVDNNIDKTVFIEDPIGYKYTTYDYLYTIDNTEIDINTDTAKIKVFTGTPYKKDDKIKGIVNNIYTAFKDIEVTLYENSDNLFADFPSVSDTHMITDITKYDYDEENNIVVINGIEYPIEFNTQKYIMLPIYVIGLSEEEGTFETNVLIHVYYKDTNEDEYCIIAVGGEFKDEEEALIINGKNMGINLPKDILRACNHYGFFNFNVDESLYNEKLKELLLNYSAIKANCGNYQSAINALKWFGYGNKITISKLLSTDNDCINQYLRDYFDINNDVPYNYQDFKNAAFIALSLKDNDNTGNIYKQDITQDFWGEGTPELEDLFNKTIEVKYDEQDISFYKQYYDYTMQEMALKMSALKYYYEKYFLPIHLKIHSSSVMHRVYTNDIKMISNCNIKITEVPQFLRDKNISVIFDNCVDINNNLIETYRYYHFIYKQIHYIDDNYNEFKNNKTIGETTDTNIYLVDDYCISIPIKFDYITNENEPDNGHFFNCNLFIYKDNTLIHSTNFQFSQCHKDTSNDYANFVIIPALLSQTFNVVEWLNVEIQIALCVNGNWYYHAFTIKNPELYLEFGTLQYDYYLDDNTTKFNQLSSIKYPYKINFNSYIHNHKLVEVTNSNFINEVKSRMIYNNTEYLVDDDNISNVYYYVIYDDTKYVIGNNYDDILINKTNKWELSSLSDNDNLKEYLNDNPIIYSSIVNTLSTYITRNYVEKPNIITNSKYLNKCYLYNIYDSEGNLLKYTYTKTDKNSIFQIDNYSWGDNTDNDTMLLYRRFFNQKNGDLTAQFKLCINNINPLMSEYFDFYLMHDTEYWYGMFISKYTLDNKAYKNEINKDDLNFTWNKNYSYVLKYSRSSNKFLINRMKYVKSTTNSFNLDDIVVATITNKDNLPFRLSLGSKWKFTPLSIGMNSDANVDSNTEMAIISIGNKNSQYERGYYNVTARYTVDNYTQNQQIKTAKIKIG